MRVQEKCVCVAFSDFLIEHIRAVYHAFFWLHVNRMRLILPSEEKSQKKSQCYKRNGEGAACNLQTYRKE